MGPEIPWHVSHFYPAYKLLDYPSTSVNTLRRARKIGLAEGLRYVYEGKVKEIMVPLSEYPTISEEVTLYLI